LGECTGGDALGTATVQVYPVGTSTSIAGAAMGVIGKPRREIHIPVTDPAERQPVEQPLPAPPKEPVGPRS